MSINPWDIYYRNEMVPYRSEAVDRLITHVFMDGDFNLTKEELLDVRVFLELFEKELNNEQSRTKEARKNDEQGDEA